VKVINRRTAFEGKHLRFMNKEAVTTTGKKIVWETIERVNVHGKGAVVIAALTRERELIMEKNWRAPSESYIIQLPAGLTDIEGESEEEAARRELLEETGYKAEKLIPIIAVPLSPDLTPTRATHFFAPEVEFSGIENNPDPTEEIEVIKVPLDKVDDFLLNLPADVDLDLRVPGILQILKHKKLI